MATQAETEAMRRALLLAAQPDAPRGPNPRVGCVLLAPDGTVVGEGHHRGAGTAHAEVDAVLAAGPRAAGATAVVTLEPCNHVGRTGACSAALIEAGVTRVVYAQSDHSPVATGGAEALREAGVDVEGGLLADAATMLNEEWSTALARGRPFVTWKVAATLDGRVAAVDGTSQWITSQESRADVHAWRARCDAVLVGTGTVVADDPHLTVRSPSAGLSDVQPLRVVMGLRDLPSGARVADSAAPTRHLRTRDPHEALTALVAEDVQHVYLEGGPTLAGAFVAAGLVDRVVAYYAPRLLGAGRSALGPAGVTTLAHAPQLAIHEITRIGPDVRLVARPVTTDEE